jgi:phage repressor protein C with HTH and peptisase S24 domain
MDDIITRIKSVIADSGLTSNAFALKVGMNSSNLSRKLNGKVPITSRDYRLICDSIGVNKDWLETGTGDKYIGEPLNGKETMQPMLGVPFYDVEFALGYDEMYNDTTNVPTKFISIPGYEKADFWCRASGDSMKPLISNGDIIALKVIPDWTEFLPMNEIYAIMTKNDLRTVKVIRRGSDNEHFTLHAINDEYEDQEINKAAITKVFKVLGALKTM